MSTPYSPFHGMFTESGEGKGGENVQVNDVASDDHDRPTIGLGPHPHIIACPPNLENECYGEYSG